MKNFKLLTCIFLFTFFASCDKEYDDTSILISDEAGALISATSTSDSAILASPEAGVPLSEAKVIITDTYLNMSIIQTSGNLNNIEKFQIVKDINGGDEVLLSETSSLPYNLEIDTIDELISGTGVAVDDLRIGDVITFRTKVVQNDGDVFYYGSSNSLTISCSSNLAGDYDLTMVSSNGWNINFPTETISQVSPGYYKTESIYRWAVGSIAPDQGFNFNDVCNNITVPDQDLAQGSFTNDVFETEPGSVNPDTGIITINYTVSFASGDVTCVGVYVPL